MRHTTLILTLLALILSSRPAGADLVANWMDVLDHAVGQAYETDPNGWRHAGNTRSDSQTALAMFEAVNAVEQRYHSYLGTLPAEAGTSAQPPPPAPRMRC